MDYKELREAVLLAAKKCYREGILTVNNGNVSVYEGGVMAITPSSIPYDEMELDDIVCVDTDGKKISGERRPSSEWRMHTVVYKEKPEVKALIHTHSPYASSFAVNKAGIPVVMIEMVPLIGGDVMVADFAMPGTEEVGRNAVIALRERYACLLANHGALAVGGDLAKAYERAACVEEVAKIYSIALSNGAVHAIPDETVEKMKRR
jgi:L-ribulose-5-phosphate 4-epimerase